MASLTETVQAGIDFYNMGQSGFYMRHGDGLGRFALHVESKSVKVCRRIEDPIDGSHRDNETDIPFRQVAIEAAQASGAELSDEQITTLELSVLCAAQQAVVARKEETLANAKSSYIKANGELGALLESLYDMTVATDTQDIQV